MRYAVNAAKGLYQDWCEIRDNDRNALMIALVRNETMAIHVATLLNIDEEENEKLEQEKRIGLSRNAETP